MNETQRNTSVTILHGPHAYQVNEDGTAYLLNPVSDAVAEIGYKRAGEGEWVMGKHWLPVEPGVAGALESAWEGLQ